MVFSKANNTTPPESQGVGALQVEIFVASRLILCSSFHLVFFETKNVGKRSFWWFVHRLPSAIFVYPAPISIHEAVPHAFLPSSCLMSLKPCCAVARQLHGHLQLYFLLEFARLSFQGTTNLLTLLDSGLQPLLCDELWCSQATRVNLLPLTAEDLSGPKSYFMCRLFIILFLFYFITFANLMLNHTKKKNKRKNNKKKKIQIHVIQYRQGHDTATANYCGPGTQDWFKNYNKN